MSDRQVIARSRSRDDGFFEIAAPAGRFTLSVSTGNGFYAERGTERSIQIKPGEATEVSDLPARQLPKIEGVVLMPSGEPAARTLVVYDERGVDPQLTDENGRFEFQVIRKDHAGVHLRVSHLTEKWSAGRAIAMDEVMLGRQVQIQLQPESELFGTVVDLDGNPLAGVHVSLGVGISFGPRGQVGTVSRYSQGGSTVTDTAGVYRFRGLSRHRHYRASIGSPLSKTSVRSPYIEPDQHVVQVDPLQISDLKATDLRTSKVDAPENCMPGVDEFTRTRT